VNGRYRDDVRSFWRGDDGMLGLFASRICGSADIYTRSGKGPEAALTCHMPRRLHPERPGELSLQHNEPNGENNLDGTRDNFSDNGGVEGETTDAGIEPLRNSRIKNFF